MGLVKAAWLEAEERGWDAPDKVVCDRCLEDEYLRQLIVENADHKRCDYCGRRSKKAIAAPVEVLMAPIAHALYSHFADPASAGLPRDDGEWVGGEAITYTLDALDSLPLNGHEDLVDDVAGGFSNDAWYPCANGYWLDDPKHVELGYAWEGFVHAVKTKTRYFFQQPAPVDSEFDHQRPLSPLELLKWIGDAASDLGLVNSMAAGTAVFRVRLCGAGVEFASLEELGPPPTGLAGAGRMNPPGISYLYTALDFQTALAEVLPWPPCRAAVASLRLRTEVRVLDLTALPDIPSIFDEDRAEHRQVLLFLGRFIHAITQPVLRDGKEHIDYVPSQVVSEYFSQVHRFDGHCLAGIVYPSAVRDGGKNAVLFPPDPQDAQWTDVVELQSVQHFDYSRWGDLARAIRDK
jgi:RES domain-containing protein